MSRISRSDAFMHDYVSTYSMRVGGSVRDQLLGRDPKDADYYVPKMTLRQLEETLWGAADAAGYTENVSVKPLRLRTHAQVGWRFTARGLGCLEIALPRTEISTGPGRHDFDIVIDPDLPIEDDALRRDFTFNALYLPLRKVVPYDAYFLKGGIGPDLVYDPTLTGMYDLEHKLIRTTHPDSFRDDPLRMLRALRFVSTLGYDLATETREQMKEHAHAATGLTRPVKYRDDFTKRPMEHRMRPAGGGGTSGTVLEELRKLLMGDDAVKALRLMRDTGVLAVVLPELAPMIGFDQASRYHTYTTDEHTFAALEIAVKTDAPLRVRMALLFHDSGKPATAWMDGRGRKHYYAHESNGHRDHEDVGAEIAQATLSRLGSPSKFRNQVATLVRHHMLWARDSVKSSEVGRLRVKLGDELFRELIMHRMCDACGKRTRDTAALSYFAMMETCRASYERLGVPRSTSELAIRGRDLLEAGVEPERIGPALNLVLDEVVCQPDERKMSREWQLARAMANATA